MGTIHDNDITAQEGKILKSNHRNDVYGYSSRVAARYLALG